MFVFEHHISNILYVHTLVFDGFTVIIFSFSPEYISKVTKLYFKHENSVQEKHVLDRLPFICIIRVRTGPSLNNYYYRVIKTKISLPLFVRSVYMVRKTCQGPLILNDHGPQHMGSLWVSGESPSICSFLKNNGDEAPKPIIFFRNGQIRLIDLRLAIDPPPPQGEFCTLWFLETAIYKPQNETC